MAFDVEEMRDHYGFCSGEDSFAGYICRYCNGRAVSFKKLQTHCLRAHNMYLNEADEANTSAANIGSPENEGKEEGCRPSKVLQSAWQCTFEKDHFVRCPACQYIANNPAEMARHYPVCKKEETNLVYICPECKGRTMYVNPLLWHLEKAHKIFKSASQFNLITKTMIAYWKRELLESYHASCLHVTKGERDCLYFDLDVLGIIEHSQSCKGPKVQLIKEHCTHCSKWTNTLGKLNHHIAMMHAQTLDRDVLGLPGKSSSFEDTGYYVEDTVHPQLSTNILTKNMATETVALGREENIDLEIVEVNRNRSTAIQHEQFSEKDESEYVKQECKYEEVFIDEKQHQISKADEKLETSTISNDVSSMMEFEIIVPSKKNTTKFEIIVPITKKMTTSVSEQNQKPVLDICKDPLGDQQVKTTIQSEITAHRNTQNQGNSAITTESYADPIVREVINPKEVTVVNLNVPLQGRGKKELISKESKPNEKHLAGKENTHSVVTMNANIEGLSFAQRGVPMTSAVDDKKRKAGDKKVLPFALFKDDFSSDEEIGFENDVKESDSKEVTSVPAGSLYSNKLYEKKIVKNYLRRPGLSKSNSMSPNKRLRTSDSFSDSDHHAEDLVEHKYAGSDAEDHKEIPLQVHNRNIMIKNNCQEIDSLTKSKSTYQTLGPLKEFSSTSEKKDNFLKLGLNVSTEDNKEHNTPNCSKNTTTEENVHLSSNTLLTIKVGATRNKQDTHITTNNVQMGECDKNIPSTHPTICFKEIPRDDQSLKCNNEETGIKQHSPQEQSCSKRYKSSRVIHHGKINSNCTLSSNTSPSSVSPRKPVAKLASVQPPSIALIKTCSEKNMTEMKSTSLDHQTSPSKLDNEHSNKGEINSTRQHIPFLIRGSLSRNYVKTEDADCVEKSSDISSVLEELDYLKTVTDERNSNKCDNSEISTEVPNLDKKQQLKSSGTEEVILVFLESKNGTSESKSVPNEEICSQNKCSKFSQKRNVLGESEEFDVGERPFNGFQEVSEKTHSRNRKFHQFLKRLSESETEEWYVNAGNLSMDVRKGESLLDSSSNNSYTIHESIKTCNIGKTNDIIQPTSLNEGGKGCELKSCKLGSDDQPNNNNNVNTKNDVKELPDLKNKKKPCPISLNVAAVKESNINKRPERLSFSLENVCSKATSKEVKDHTKKVSSKHDLDIAKVLKKEECDQRLKHLADSMAENQEVSKDRKASKCLTTSVIKKVKDISQVLSNENNSETSSITVDINTIAGRFRPSTIEQKEKHHSFQSDIKENHDIINKSDSKKRKCTVKSVIVGGNTHESEPASNISVEAGNSVNHSQFILTKRGRKPKINFDKNSKSVEHLFTTNSSGNETSLVEFSENNINRNTILTCQSSKEQEETVKCKSVGSTSTPGRKSSSSPVHEKTFISDISTTSTPLQKHENQTKGSFIYTTTTDAQNSQKIGTDLVSENTNNSLDFAATDKGQFQCSFQHDGHKELGLTQKTTLETNLSKDIIPLSIRKKRGRPPKSSSVNLSDDLEHKLSTTQDQCTKSNTSTTVLTTSSEFKKGTTTQNNLIIPTKQSVNNNKVITSKVQKRRGRPPKVRQNENNGTSTSQQNYVQSKESDSVIAFSTGSEKSDVGKDLFINQPDVTTGLLKEKEVDSNIKEISCVKETNKITLSKHPGTDVYDSKTNGQNFNVDTNKDIPTFLPKKRGRKPKAKISDNTCVNKSSTQTSEDSILSEQSRLKIDAIEGSCDTDINKSVPIPAPKKRGRPPLNKENNKTARKLKTKQSYKKGTNTLKCETLNDSVADCSETQTDKSEKSFLEISDQITQTATLDKNALICDQRDTSTSVILPKKRGRPPKSINNTTCLNSGTIHDKTVEKLMVKKEFVSSTPKRRGRKPKLKQDSSSGLSPIPKKRGRKPKLNKNNEQDMSQATETIDSCDVSCDGSLNSATGTLLGTDVIIINNRRLDSMFNISKESTLESKRVCKDDRKRQKCSENNIELEEPDYNLSSDISRRNSRRRGKKIILDDFHYSDEDFDSSWEDISLKSKRKRVTQAKKKKIVYDDDLHSDDEQVGESNEESDSEVRKPKMSTYRPAEDILFSAKHKASDKVTCGVCKEEMTYKVYYNEHALYKHYMLCWLHEEEPPIDMNDEKDVINRLWWTKKKIGKTPFKCFNCNLPKLSAVGFNSHIRFCGKDEKEKEAMLVTCELCGARVMPSSMKPHMYTKHSTAVDTTPIIPKSRRAAATRAVSVIISQNEKEEDEQPGDEDSRAPSPESKQHLAHLYIKPSRVVPPAEFKRWQAVLKERNIVTCSNPGCDFSANTTVAVRKHYFNCPFVVPPRVYRCRHCEFTSETEPPMQDHVKDNHDYFMDHSSGSDGSDSEGGSSSNRPVSYQYKLPLKFLRNGAPKIRGHPRKVFTEALTWTHEMRQDKLVQNEQVLFSGAEAGCSSWVPLTAEAATPYLPHTQVSASFRGSDASWHTLRRFEGTLLDGVPVMFAGGPVWALAWAPVPDTERQQYLAVAVHPDMEQTHEMASVYKYDSLIQIWAFGYLDNIEPNSGSSPKFVMGLAHSRGAVWALQWCPSGCYQDSRLGLLAAASSDGSVAIYSVPRYRYSFEYLFYNVQPVMELRLGCEMLTQCRSIDWHSVAPHSVIVGGFANGMVAVWNLHSNSSLLRDGSNILPYHVIEGHLSAVTAVRLSASLEDMYLLTASLDRATKFWRLDDTTAPVSCLRKTAVMDATMPLHWITSINAYDDVFSLNSSFVTGYNFRETFNSANTNYLLQPGTVWSISFNDWLNACACASETGKVTVFFRQQILIAEDSRKIRCSSLLGDIISCEVLPLSGSVPTDPGQKYTECVANVGLDIAFKEDIKETCKSKPASSSDTMDKYPLQSINKVTWNSNMHSFSWLAAGLQCGLVMAPRVKCLLSKDFTEVYLPRTDR